MAKRSAKKAKPRTQSARQAAFLAAYEITANIERSAKIVGMSHQNHYNWLVKVPGYRERFDAAFVKASHVLEEEAIRRAVQGVRRDILYQGVKVGEELIYSDTLLIFLLKGMRPERYREKYDVLVRKSDDEINRELTEALAELAARQASLDVASDSPAIEHASAELLPASTVPKTTAIPRA